MAARSLSSAPRSSWQSANSSVPACSAWSANSMARVRLPNCASAPASRRSATRWSRASRKLERGDPAALSYSRSAPGMSPVSQRRSPSGARASLDRRYRCLPRCEDSAHDRGWRLNWGTAPSIAAARRPGQACAKGTEDTSPRLPLALLAPVSRPSRLRRIAMCKSGSSQRFKANSDGAVVVFVFGAKSTRPSQQRDRQRYSPRTL